MAWMHIKLQSKALRMPASVEVLIPQKLLDKKKSQIPALYLLHGWGGDHTEWLRKAPLEVYSEEFQIAMVMPSGNNSYFADMKYGRKYQTYIKEELPRRMEEMFALSPHKKDRYLAGVSMGGYGALSIALEGEGLFQKVGIFSAPVTLEKQYETDKKQMENIFGTIEEWKDNRLKITEGRKYPDIYLMCSKKDDIYYENQKIYYEMKEKGLPVTFKESEAKPDWYYHNDCLKCFLEYI